MAQPAVSANPLSGEQQRIIWIAWGTYAAFYLGRLNLSQALPAIADTLNIGLGEVGLLGTVFFLCYALGQFINGQLGNYLQPHWIIFSGLLLIAISNIAFAFQSTLWLMAVIWGINGFAQATGWGPMLKIISAYLNPTQRQKVSTLFPMSFQVGTAVSWGLAGLLLLLGDWRTAFWVPGVLLIGVSLLWRWSGLDTSPDKRASVTFSLSDMLQEIRHLFPMLVVAACVGFVYIGFLLWLPTFIQSWDFLPDVFSQVITVIAPLVGIPGMWLAGFVLVRQENVLRTIFSFLLVLLLLLLASSLMTTAIQMVFVLGAMMVASGLAGLILSSAPMLLTSPERVSSAGGLMTMTWSIAGGIAGTVVGSVAEQWGWTSVFMLWFGMTLFAMAGVWFASLSLRYKR